MGSILVKMAYLDSGVQEVTLIDVLYMLEVKVNLLGIIQLG
jgi:hypothetical protein